MCEWGLWDEAGGASAAPTPRLAEIEGEGWSGAEHGAPPGSPAGPSKAPGSPSSPSGRVPHKNYYGNTSPKPLILLGVRLAFRTGCKARHVVAT
jgi:hypothetical protein